MRVLLEILHAAHYVVRHPGDLGEFSAGVYRLETFRHF